MRAEKIIIDGRLLSNRTNGISRYTEHLIYSYFLNYGQENVFILVNDEGLKNKFKNIICTYLKPFNIRHFLKFTSFLEKLEFDIYHTAFYSGVSRRIKNKQIRITVHDLMYAVVPRYFSDNPIRNYLSVKYYDFIVRQSCRNADFIISVSNTTAADLKSRFNYDSFVIYGGKNKLLIDEGNKTYNLLNKHGLETKKFFLYVGNLRRSKNIDFLLKSFIKSKVDADLVIAGSYLEEETIKFAKSNNIKFIGYINDSDLVTLYQNCKAFVFPSKYEGFGLPILEALDNGASVISSNAGALKEFSKDLVTFFDPEKENELVEILKVDFFHTNINLLKEELKKYNWEDNFRLMHKKLKGFQDKFNSQ